MAEDPDPQAEAAARDRDRTERIEELLIEVEEELEDPKYPVAGEEVAAAYARQATDLPDETESLGDAFDRLTDEEYATPAEVKEALYNALTGEEAGPEEYEDERPLDELARDTSAAESRD